MRLEELSDWRALFRQYRRETAEHKIPWRMPRLVPNILKLDKNKYFYTWGVRALDQPCESELIAVFAPSPDSFLDLRSPDAFCFIRSTNISASTMPIAFRVNLYDPIDCLNP